MGSTVANAAEEAVAEELLLSEELFTSVVDNYTAATSCFCIYSSYQWMNSRAKVTNSKAKVTNSKAKATNSFANRTNSFANRTNSFANGTKSIAKRTNSIAKTCNKVVIKTTIIILIKQSFILYRLTVYQH